MRRHRGAAIAPRDAGHAASARCPQAFATVAKRSRHPCLPALGRPCPGAAPDIHVSAAPGRPCPERLPTPVSNVRPLPQPASRARREHREDDWDAMVD